MNVEIYKIVWKNIAINITPYFWRDLQYWNGQKTLKNWFLEYVYCVLEVFIDLTNRLYNLAATTKIKLNYTGQVGVLNIALNDYFDGELRRIYISDDYSISNKYPQIYQQAEINPYPIDIYEEDETNPTPFSLYPANTSVLVYDFFVNVPSGLAFDYNRMYKFVSSYKLAGKHFNIVTF